MLRPVDLFGYYVFVTMVTTTLLTMTSSTLQEPEVHNRNSKKPYIIAHRGSSGTLPENTVMAHQMAVQQGADILECDVTITKDLRLILLHEPWLGDVTDAENKLDPSKRKTRYIKDIDDTVTDYFSVDFTWNELRSLRVNQRYQSRDQSYNNQLPIATLEEFIEVAQILGKRTRLLIELKQPEFINSLSLLKRHGKRFEDLVLKVLTRYGYTDETSPVILQSFTESSLQYLKDVTTIPLFKIIDEDDSVDASKLQDYSTYLHGISVNKQLIFPTLYKKIIQRTDLIDRAHSHGLEVFVWTFRNEYQFLPWEFNQDPYQELDKYSQLGIDGFITDFPATASQFMTWRYSNECTCTQSKQTSHSTAQYYNPLMLPLLCFMYL